MKNIILYISLVTSLAVFTSANIIDGGSQETTDEYKIKLTVIEKITPFIDWAGNRVEKDDTPFYFGIYGDVHPFGEDLTRLKTERKLKFKTVEVRFFEVVEDFSVNYPDLLFFPRGFSDKITETAEALKSKPTLLIGEEKGLIEKGSDIDIYLDNDKLHIELNRENLKRKGFKISEDLIRLAD